MVSAVIWPHNIYAQLQIKLPLKKFHIVFHMIILLVFKILDQSAISQEAKIGATFLITLIVVQLKMEKHATMFYLDCIWHMITLIQVQLILRKMAYIVYLTMDKNALKIMDHNAI